MRDLSLRGIATFAMSVALMVGCGGTIAEGDAPAAQQSSNESKVHAMGDGHCDPTCTAWTFCCHTTDESPWLCYQSWYDPCDENGGCTGNRHCVTNAGISQCFSNDAHCD